MSLLGLPDETLLRIVHDLEDNKDLYRTRRVCKRLNVISFDPSVDRRLGFCDKKAPVCGPGSFYLNELELNPVLNDLRDLVPSVTECHVYIPARNDMVTKNPLAELSCARHFTTNPRVNAIRFNIDPFWPTLKVQSKSGVTV